MDRPFGSRTRLIYYMLVAFSLVTVAYDVYLSTQLSASRRRTIAANELLASQLARLGELDSAAGEVELPGNDVFASGDVANERARTQTALQKFTEAMRQVRVQARDRRLVTELDEVGQHMRHMLLDAEEIFRLVELNKTDAAGASMVHMDHDYASLRSDLSEARSVVRNQQLAEFRQESLFSARLARLQILSAVLMALLIVGLFLYGRRIDREFVSSRERERNVESLRAKTEELRLAVAERDAQSEELIQSRQLLSEAQRVANIGAWEWRIASGRVWWSDQLYRLFGLEPGSVEPSYAGYMERVAPADRERVAAGIARAVQDHKSYEIEYGILHPDGQPRVHRSAARVDVDEQGNAVRMFGVAQDITERKWAEEQLLRQEAQLAEAQRIARIGSWELDVVTQHVTWSDELHEILGYASGEASPSFKAYMSLIPEHERRRVYALLEKAMQTGNRFNFEHSLVRADGAEIWLSVQGIVDRDAEGKPARVLGVSQDVTDRKRAEEELRLSEERFQLASRATNDVIWDRDLITNKVWVNESWSSRMGYPEWGSIDLQVWTGNLHPDDAERVIGSITTAAESDAATWTSQYRFRAFGGGWREVLDRGHIVRDPQGRAVRLIGAMTDISERRAVDRMKDEFISTVSHELRTPLTSIRGALGLLSSGRLGTLPEKGKRLLEIASSNTDRLVRLINDILDIERIESGKVTLTKTRCDAEILARSAAEVVASLAERESISIVLDTQPVELMADSDRMVQVLTNLLANAVKFSPSGSSVRLSVRAEGPDVVFAVADKGRGIPPDKVDTIFERFQQVDASDSRDKGGSGLGLAICRSIVRQHGGTIRVESTPGSGSTFVVSVPSGIAPASSIAPIAQKVVFVCDDDTETRDVIKFFLNRRGYRVVEAASGQELLDAVRLEKPDAILLDIFMPDMNGFETMARLKDDPSTAGVPIIVISVLSPHETGAPEFDLSGWVEKPLDEDALASVIDRAFRGENRRPRVVLVEDDEDLSAVILESLGRYGIETIHARNGREAIGLAKTVEPDLLILDLVLPEIDGYGLVEWLKDHAVWRSVPLVVYSATEPSPSQQERLRLGPTQFLTKSRVAPDEFEQRIVALIDTVTSGRKGFATHDA